MKPSYLLRTIIILLSFFAFSYHAMAQIYCAAGAELCDEYIINVTVAGINNSTGCGLVNGYTDYTTIVAPGTMTAGLPYQITVTNPNPYSSDVVYVWVDWNNNGLFTDAGEQYILSTVHYLVFTGTIICPASTLTGPKRMRVRMSYGQAPNPCGIETYGEVEDYTINVTNCLNDTQPPMISMLAPVTANNDPGICGRHRNNVALGIPTASDNCGPVTITNNAPTIFPVGTTTVTWTATDASNNQATSTQQVTIIDIQPPTVVAPAAVVMDNEPGQCGRSASLVSLGTPTATDNCGVVSLVNNAPTYYPVGVTTVTWTAQDAQGNMATATQTVTIRDVEKPTINAPANVTVNADANVCGRASAFNLGTPTASDNCGAVTITNSAPAVFPVGTTTLVWTATDQHGNFATASQQITVIDVTPPVITVNLFPQYLMPANRSMRSITASVTISDNCPGSRFELTSVTSNEPDAGTGPGDLPNDILAATGNQTTQFALRAETAQWSMGRIYTVNYTAIDNSGNRGTTTRWVYVPGFFFFKDGDVVFSDEASVPETPSLEQNFPNPFASSTSIVFRLPEDKAVTLSVYDALGREVSRLADGIFSSGSHAVIFEANDLPDGVYYARLMIGSEILQKKMLLVRGR
jgi:hypothetical protein